MSASAISIRAGAIPFILVAVLATLLLSATAPVSGQAVVSLRGGVNSASAKGFEGSRTGLNIGAGLNVGVAGNLGLQLGASLSRKGTPLQSGTQFDPNSGTQEVFSLGIALDYLEVPALLHLTIPSSVAVAAHFLVGPVLGIHVGCEYTLTVTVLSQVGETLDEQKASLGECPASPKAVDLGAMGGVGVDFDPSDHLRLTLDLLYNLGLTTIFGGGDAKNRTFSVIAGVGIPVG